MTRFTVRPNRHAAWIVLSAVTLILLAGSGVRSSFGVFIKPLEAEFGWPRVALSAVASLSLLLYGAIGPLVGRLADRWGPRGILIGAVGLLAAGTLAAATTTALWHLYLFAGVVAALGAGGAAMSVAASLITRWFDARRGLVLGIAGGGMAAGQLLIVPAIMSVTLAWGWRASYLVLGLGLLVLVLPLAVVVVRNDPRDLGLRPYGAAALDASPGSGNMPVHRTGIVAAARTLPFWLLAGSFWVCGYTTSGLVFTHLIPHTTEHGFHATQAATALGVMGALNMAGTVGSGWICDRWGPRLPLAAYYALRGVSLLFLPYVGSLFGLFAFAAVFGLNYISTVPATTALTARLFGRYSVGELSGWIFFSHQIGAAVGSMVGGYLYGRFGDYSLAFHSAAALAFAAAAMVAAIRADPTPDVRAVPPKPVPAAAPGVP